MKLLWNDFERLPFEAADHVQVPMVEIFETVEGEGLRAGHPTTFVRVFNCNLRCTWCDTVYSYAPAKPEFHATPKQIAEKVMGFGHHYVCFTGGEPLIHGPKSQLILDVLSRIPSVEDIHIETNGAIELAPFAKFRSEDEQLSAKVRFVIDYKLPASGEMDEMIHENFDVLLPQDEIKFVIADEGDFETAKDVVERFHNHGQVLFSPVWESMPPAKLVDLILKHKLHNVKLNMQIHKVIWDPAARGV